MLSSTSDERLPPIRLQVLIYPPTQLVNLSTTSYLVNRHDFLFPKEEAARNRVRLLLGEAQANDARMCAAVYASNMTTAATRARLAPLFELGATTTATEDPETAVQMSGDKNDVDAIVRADEREFASRLRETEPSEHHPIGDRALENQLLARLIDPELSPLLADSFEVFT